MKWQVNPLCYLAVFIMNIILIFMDLEKIRSIQDQQIKIIIFTILICIAIPCMEWFFRLLTEWEEDSNERE